MAALIKLSQRALRNELVRAVDFQNKGVFFEAHFFFFSFSVFFSNCFANLYEQIIKNNNVLKKNGKNFVGIKMDPRLNTLDP